MENSVKINNSLLLATGTALMLLLVFVIGLIIFSLNKGFELSDESYYCLASKFPDDTRLINSYFGLVNYKFTFGNTDLLALRGFKFVYQTLALLMFGLSFFVFLRKKFSVQKQYFFSILGFIVISGYVNYDYLPMTLSYNSWSLILSLVYWSAFLISISYDKSWVLIVSGAAVGFVSTVLFYVKLPNAIFLFAIFTGYFLFFNLKKLIPALLVLFTGSIVALFFLFGSAAFFMPKTLNLIDNLKGSNHASVSFYFEQCLDLIDQAGALFCTVQLLLPVAMFVIRKRKMNWKPGLFLIFCNLLFTLLYMRGNSRNVVNDFLMVFTISVSSAALLVLFYDKNKVKVSNPDLYIFGVLFLTPFLLALGTSNTIFYTSSQSLVYFITFVIGSTVVLNSNKTSFYYSLCAVFSSLLFVCAIYNGMCVSPYRQSALIEKKLPIIFATGFGNVYENQERFEAFCGATIKLKKHNRDLLPVLASPPCLGVIMLSGMSPFAMSWISDTEEYVEVNEKYFEKYSPKNRRPFLLISDKIPRSEKQRAIFKKNGIDFNNNYSLCDSVCFDFNKEYFYFYKPI
jgi:hypothetical protein